MLRRAIRAWLARVRVFLCGKSGTDLLRETREPARSPRLFVPLPHDLEERPAAAFPPRLYVPSVSVDRCDRDEPVILPFPASAVHPEPAAENTAEAFKRRWRVWLAGRRMLVAVRGDGLCGDGEGI